jgi:hypothetical protein
MRTVKSLLPVVAVACLLSSLTYAATPDRISGAIDSSNMVELKGHVSPLARAQFDQGPVEPSRGLHITMMFLPTAAQNRDLEKLIADQQDPTSPKFHQWLTPEQFGARFGVSQGDTDKISAWLKSQGFKVTYVARGREFLSFDGNAGQIESTFQTEIHSFNVNGKMHFANVKAPRMPAALSGIVGAFRGMHDFLPRSMLKKHPDYTVSISGQTFEFLAPGDIATIYDINPLYQATPKIDGTGESVVIAGQTDVYLADLNDFRGTFGLSTISGSGCTTATGGWITACSASNFQMLNPGTGGDPGVSAGDLGESDLDIEWVGSVARGAKIIFVTSSQGVDDSASWAIDQQLAPVISYSYGLCEAFVTESFITADEAVYKQGATEGISFFAAAGDGGAASCDADLGNNPPAVLGASVSYPASSAYITGVGGTEFNEGSGSYWNPTNGTTDGGSAKSYIPELGWNDSVLVGTFDATGGGPSNCAKGTTTTSVDGFAFEVCNAPPNGGFPKPTWQNGITPADGVRDVPDISFSASNANDAYIVCAPQSEVVQGSTVTTSTCATSVSDALTQFNPPSAFGGTSASTPVAAGMAVLLNQYLGGPVGLVNNQLYTVLYKNHASVFHDVLGGTSTTGTGDTSDNIEECTDGQPSFEPSALQCSSGTIGTAAGTGYDMVTGLGSLDINAFIVAWGSSRATTTTTISPSATAVNQGSSVTFTADVTPTTATGTVGFYNNGSTTALGTGTISSGVATFTTTALPAGIDSVTATYSGDAGDGISTSATPAVVTVTAVDFSLGASPGTANVIAGQTSGAITVTVTPTNGFNSQISFSCTGLPTGATCNFSPTTVTPNGTAAVTTSLTISTAANTAAATTSVTVSATGSSITHTAAVSLIVAATDQSFTLAPKTATYQVLQGQSVSATIVLTAANGFNTPVTYTCSDAASESTCTGPSGATANTMVSFAITTTAATSQLRRPLDRGTGLFYAALLPGLMGIVFTLGSRQRSLGGMRFLGLRLLGLIVMLGFSTLWLGSCGGNSGTKITNPGTPKGSYIITVNATTGGASPITGTTTFTVQVQ